MMRLNLDNLSTLSPLDLFSTANSSPSAGVTDGDSFIDHLDRARQTVGNASDDPTPSDRRSDAAADSRSSNDRTSASDDTEKPAQAESRDKSSRRAEKQDQEHQANDDAEARAAEEQAAKERDEEAADEEDADKEAAAAELAAASSSVQEAPKEAADTAAAEASETADATEQIAAAGSTAMTLGGNGLPGTNPTTPQPTAPAEGQLQPANPTADSSTEEKKDNVTVASPDVAGAAEPTATGETPAESVADQEKPSTTDEQTTLPPTAGQAGLNGDSTNQGTSDGSGNPSGQNAEALDAASALRADARRQVGRQKKGDANRSDDQPSEASPDTGNAVGPGTPATDTQQAAVEPLVAAPEVRADAADSKDASSSTGKGGDQKVDSAQRASAGETQQSTATSKGEKTSGVDVTDRVRFVQRVARAVESMGNREGTIRMALAPPELGSLKLQLTVRDGTMEARVEVETDGARSLLMDNLPALRERLAEHNIKVERFDVGLSNQSLGGSSQGTGQQQSQSQEHSRSGFGLASRAGKSADPVESRPRARQGGTGRLDVVI